MLIFVDTHVLNKTGKRYIQSDPIGLEGGINTYAYVGGNPLSFVYFLGLYIEVYTFEPVGWGSSSFGHTAIKINGSVYSWGPSGLWTGTPGSYLGKNDFRSAVGAVLNSGKEQEATLEQFIKDYQKEHEYNSVLENCGDPIEEVQHPFLK